jgi:hypothetical protein
VQEIVDPALVDRVGNAPFQAPKVVVEAVPDDLVEPAPEVGTRLELVEMGHGFQAGFTGDLLRERLAIRHNTEIDIG